MDEFLGTLESLAEQSRCMLAEAAKDAYRKSDFRGFCRTYAAYHGIMAALYAAGGHSDKMIEGALDDAQVAICHLTGTVIEIVAD